MADWKPVARSALTRFLIAFALVSIGYTAGKHAGRSTALAGRTCPATATEDGVTESTHVVVYYMHATFRCVTCNTIETMTRKLLEEEFGEQLKAGQVRMVEVNFQENEDRAKRYEVASSCVVVTKWDGGREVEHQRLDEVWTLMDKPPEFNRYVGGAVRDFLREGVEE